MATDDDLLSGLVSGNPQSADQVRAIVQQLRSKGQLADLAQMTGDPALAPFGQHQNQINQQNEVELGRNAMANRMDDIRTQQFQRQLEQGRNQLAEEIRWHNMVDQRDRDLAAERAQDKKDAQEAAKLDPDTLHTAISSVMSDPSTMRQYAGYGGPSGAVIRKQINDGITQRLKDTGMNDSDLGAIRANFAGQKKSVATLIPQLNNIAQFEQTAKFNGDRLLQLIDGVDTTGVPALEGAIRTAKAKGGNVDVNEFNSVLNQFQTEAARITQNPNLTGILSDKSKEDLQKVIAGNLDAPSMRRIINRLYAEFDMRKMAIQQQVAGANAGMSGLSGGNPSALPGATGALGGLPPVPGSGPPQGPAPAAPSALPGATGALGRPPVYGGLPQAPISPLEATLRSQTGALADGSPAPQTAVVDNQGIVRKGWKWIDGKRTRVAQMADGSVVPINE